MSNMLDLLRRLYPLRMAPVSSGVDKVTEILCRELPFTIHEYSSQSEHNGWVVPSKWEVMKAEIIKNGEVIYDGMTHPLGVIGYSQSFQGQVGLDELRKHLFYHPLLPKALVYHCDLYYKVGRSNWGFCVTDNFFHGLREGEYIVDLQTVHENGTMKVCDYFIQGEVDKTILFNAHNCHAGQANDDISGIVVGVEIMRRLASCKNYYSYRLIIAPEHFGTIFYLAGLSQKVVKTFAYCIFLEMLGNNNRLALQESFTGQTELDRAAYHYLSHNRPDFFSDKFRKIVGNDETVWESPGFEIPTISLSRSPYAEYHSSMDTDDIIFEEKMEDAVEAVLDIVEILEKNCVMNRQYDGLIALSNPKYNLYIDMADPSIRPSISAKQREWNYLMDCLPRYFDNKMTILDISEKHKLPFNQVHEYISKFREKRLIEMIKIDSE